jgi:hypothetical protein
VTLDPTGNNIRWRYSPPDSCVLLGADAGSAGVAVLQRCSDAPDVQLRLFDGFEGGTHWTRDLPAREGAELRLLGADGLLGVLVDDEFQAVGAADGTVLRRLPVAEPDDVQLATVGTVALVRVGGTLSALDTATAAPLWTAPATGLPAPPENTAALAPLPVPEAAGFALRDAGTGAERGRVAATGVPAGGRASVVGHAVVHRLPDRVVAFR